MKKWISFISSLILAIAIGMMGNASGSITVDWSVQKHEVPISGGTFSIAKIMDQDGGHYTLREEAERAGLTQEDILKDTVRTATLLNGKLSAERSLTTKNDGKITFDDLSDGVYLVWMSDREGEALKYKEATPAIVSLPAWNKGVLVYEQTIYPKTAKLAEPEEDHHPKPGEKTPGSREVKTGDQTNIVFWICLLLLAGMSILAISTKEKEKV